MERRDILEHVPLLRGLTREARHVLAERAVTRRFAAGEVLWTARSEPRGLFIVLEGLVRVVRAPDGRQYVLHTEGPGGTLGEVPFFSEGDYPATAIAVAPSLCLIVDRHALAHAFQLDSDLAFRLLARLAERVRVLVARLDRNTRQPVVARVAEYLLSRHEADDRGVISLGGRQIDVAEELGTVREVLVRTIRHLREAGLIESAGRGRYRVVDEAALRLRTSTRVAASDYRA